MSARCKCNQDLRKLLEMKEEELKKLQEENNRLREENNKILDAVTVDKRMREYTPNSYAQWRTDCPSCGHDILIVESVTLCATGEEHHPRSVLKADGFEVNCSDVLRDQSTQDEVIRCGGCGKQFELSELVLD